MSAREAERGRVEALLLLPGLAAFGTFLAWGALDGGYPPTVWYPGALFLLGLGAVVAASGRAALPGTAARLAVGFLAAFALWSALSLAWAHVEGDAWDGANRTLLYVVVYTLFAAWPWRPAGAVGLLLLFSAGVAVTGAATFAQAAASAEAASFFTSGRFSEPVGYVNANTALFLIAFWPSVFLASRREVPAAARGLALAAGGTLLELALLTQSRGSLFAFPAVLLLFVVLVPDRLRGLTTLVPALGAVVLARGPLLDVFHVAEGSGGRDELLEARNAIALTALVLFVVGAAAGWVDRRVELPTRLTTWTARAVAVGAVAFALVAALALVDRYGNPATRVSAAWDEFTAGQPEEIGSSYFASGLGSNRYDFWRVGFGEFTEAPLQGIGAENFAVAYLEERESDEEPLYPHSLEIQVLSQTGIVGALLFLGFLAAALAGAWRARASARGLERGLVSVCVVAFAYWFAHGSVDWFWEFPGLAAPALACLGLAAGLAPRAAGLRVARRSGPGRRAGAAAFAVIGVVAAISFALPWLAAREVDRAAAVWRDDPDEAYEALANARRLNPLSDRPDLVAGAIASRLDDLERMRASFVRALERNPANWYAHLELAIAAALSGERERALAQLARARELNPAEPVLGLVGRQIRSGEPVSPRAVDRLFLQRVEQRTS
jgi:tetratricopeptide (TPR) repeat protein